MTAWYITFSAKREGDICQTKLEGYVYSLSEIEELLQQLMFWSSALVGGRTKIGMMRHCKSCRLELVGADNHLRGNFLSPGTILETELKVSNMRSHIIITPEPSERRCLGLFITLVTKVEPSEVGATLFPVQRVFTTWKALRVVKQPPNGVHFVTQLKSRKVFKIPVPIGKLIL